MTGVAVTPSDASVVKGATQSFTAAVSGTGEFSQDVTWSIVEGIVEGTSVSTAGVLTVNVNETVATLTVKATSVTDTSISGTATVTVIDPADVPVTIPDTQLKLAINAALKKASDHVITVGDMQGLTELDASDWGIKSLTGLWTAVNLESLDLSGNPLTANVTSTTTYNNIFVGIEALSKLKVLDLSGCDLGINPTSPANISMPTSLYSAGVNLLESLEVLDLSGNRLKSSFFLTFYSTKLTALKEIDLSDNEFNTVTLSKAYFPSLERIDISRNYIYFDESESFYTTVVDMGVENWVHENMKNLADLYAIKVTNAGAATTYYGEEDQYTIDAGTVMGDSLTFSCQVFSSANTVKVTVDGQKYTSGSLATAGTSIPLSGLALGEEHTVSFEVMHLSGDTRTYSLKFTTTALPSGTAGITDANLQAAVCKKLGRDAATYAVTIEDMQGLTGSLGAITGLSNVEGIQYGSGTNKPKPDRDLYRIAQSQRTHQHHILDR